MKTFNAPPQPSSNASILSRIKEGYLIWMHIVPHIPKGARYTIGERIENKFLDLLELSYTTYFTSKDEKAEKITECVLVLDTLKFLISVAWEAKLISHNCRVPQNLQVHSTGITWVHDKKHHA